MQLTEQMVINHLGQPVKKQGNELVFQCPICMDKGKDNLKYNTAKNVLYCFADDTHAPMICKEIYKKNLPPKVEQTSELPKYIKYADEMKMYYFITHKMLMGNEVSKDALETICDDENEVNKYLEQQKLNRFEKALDYLYEQRKITAITACISQLGYDFVDNKWVFPIRRLQDNRLVGFRYRGGDLTNKTIWSETGTPNCLAIIWGKTKAENLYICEGEWDSLAMMDILSKYNKLDNSTIIMPTNGAKSLLKHITDIELNNFDNIHLCLDNDKGKVNKLGKPDDVSWQTTQELLKIYPKFIDNTPQGCKDINDWWKEHKDD